MNMMLSTLCWEMIFQLVVIWTNAAANLANDADFCIVSNIFRPYLKMIYHNDIIVSVLDP